MSHYLRGTDGGPLTLDIPDADVRFWSKALAPDDADAWLDILRNTIAWEQEEIVIFGRQHAVPRLVAWYGDAGAAYTYSGTPHVSRPWTAELLAIRARVVALTRHEFNSVLLNRYRNGRDGMGWHADDEPELGRNPVVASVSLGAARRFKLRHRKQKQALFTLELGHGSLLLMAGTTQHNYLHAVPKTTLEVGERINLTFRCVTPNQ